MSASEVNFRDPANWIVCPSRFPGYPPAKVRKSLQQTPAGLAYLNGWWRFFSGFAVHPPQPPEILRRSDSWRSIKPSNEGTGND